MPRITECRVSIDFLEKGRKTSIINSVNSISNEIDKQSDTLIKFLERAYSSVSKLAFARVKFCKSIIGNVLNMVIDTFETVVTA